MASAAEGDERELRAARRPLERRDAGRDGGENKRIGEGLRDHPGGIDEIRERNRERGDSEGDARREAEPPRKPVHRNGREGHGERSDRLRQVIRDADVAEEPGRRRKERFEERGEVRRVTPDERTAGLGERAAQGRVEVLVAEVDGRGAQPGERDAHGKAEPDDAGKKPSSGETAALDCRRRHRQTRVVWVGPRLPQALYRPSRSRS